MHALGKLNRDLKWWIRHNIESRMWRKRLFDVPAPQKVKWAVLDRHKIPGATWVETGTYLGDTTEFLATRALLVYSIEPADFLYEAAARRFKNQANVRVLHGTSETIFPGLCREIRGKVCFWLDGHASGGVTFQGASSTPIMDELREIEASMKNFSSIAVLIDDMRCFEPAIPMYADYPPRSRVVDWAEKNQLTWHIEHDIFIAKRT
jgi:hypothetical protein